MSRGLGDIQRRTVAAVQRTAERDWEYAANIPGQVFRIFADPDDGEPISPTRSQQETVFRALRTLARRGLIRLKRQSHYGRSYLWVLSVASSEHKPTTQHLRETRAGETEDAP